MAGLRHKMGLTGTRTYVGFGFGAIQGGLFLYEAFQSGAFRRLVVAEVVPELVAAVRGTGGRFGLNIAHADRIERVEIGPVEIYNPAVEADRTQLVTAIGEAEELGTAVPSVVNYVTGGVGAVSRLLGAGLALKLHGQGPRAVVYAAENHNHAAEILQGHVLGALPPAAREGVERSVRFLNTVIGKMSRVVTDPEEIQAQALAPIAPGQPRAFLVEAFNRIMVSRVRFETPFERGIAVFEEKDDLLPFEEAKLYGHNAVHALGAYLGYELGARYMSELTKFPGVLPFMRGAFLEESGEALVRKYRGADPLFTHAGYAEYADDLLKRMTNPFLMDTIERVARDPGRKLGWGDRLIGTMRLALEQGITPRRFAVGAAAALAMLDPTTVEDSTRIPRVLATLWGDSAKSKEEQASIVQLVQEGQARLREWKAAGCADLEAFDNVHWRR